MSTQQIIGPVVVSGLTMRVNEAGKAQYQREDGDWVTSSKTAKQVAAAITRNETKREYARQKYQSEKTGVEMVKPKPRVYQLSPGDVLESRNFGPYVVVSDNGPHDVVVRFPSGYEVQTTRTSARSGSIKDRFARTVSGVGYSGGTKHKAGKRAYLCWREMLRNCYVRNDPRTVCDEWHNYQEFAEWYYSHGVDEEQNYRVDMQAGSVFAPGKCKLVRTRPL